MSEKTNILPTFLTKYSKLCKNTVDHVSCVMSSASLPNSFGLWENYLIMEYDYHQVENICVSFL